MIAPHQARYDRIRLLVRRRDELIVTMANAGRDLVHINRELDRLTTDLYDGAVADVIRSKA